jgi:hypothetical protein
MNTHKNARLTFVRRPEMVRDIVETGMTPMAAAAVHEAGARPRPACGVLR